MGIARVVLLLYYFTNQVRFKTLKHMIIIMYVVPPLRGICKYVACTYLYKVRSTYLYKQRF